MKFGLDRLVASRPLRKGLQGKRVALLGHPASVTRDLTHALDALAALPDVELSAALRPMAVPSRSGGTPASVRPGSERALFALTLP